VQFVDFGNYVTVKSSDLFLLSTEFINEPCYAIHCETNMVCPIDGENYDDDLDIFTVIYDMKVPSSTVKTT